MLYVIGGAYFMLRANHYPSVGRCHGVGSDREEK
jgi:hypothetical protein